MGHADYDFANAVLAGALQRHIEQGDQAFRPFERKALRTDVFLLQEFFKHHRVAQLVENSQLLAATQVARSAPDGYTLLMTTNSTHGANSHIYKSLPYDPLRDFQPVVRTATLPFMLVINPSVPANTTAEFIAHAKAHRGELSYGTASTTSLIGAETINRLAGTGLTYGPAFRGLREVWRYGDQILAEVSLPEELIPEAHHFGLHPALLDAATHALALTRVQAGDRARVPFSWRGVRLHATGATAVRVRLRSNRPAKKTAAKKAATKTSSARKTSARKAQTG